MYCMSTMVKTHLDEVRAVMESAVRGELAEADAVRTIILLQRELINALISHNTHSREAPAGLTEESTLLSKEAA